MKHRVAKKSKQFFEFEPFLFYYVLYKSFTLIP